MLNIILIILGATKSPASAVANSINVSQNSTSVSVSFNIVNGTEDNLPPSIEDVYLTSTFLVGDTVTAAVRDFFSRSGYSAGSHIYKFYRSIDNKGQSETLVQNSTSNVYTLVSGDNGRFIRCEVTPVQSGGLNTTGDPVSSIYSPVTSTAFDLWSTIPWNGAYKLNTSGDLANYGLATNKDSSPAVATNGPLTFDGAKTLTRFTRASSQYLSCTQGETLTQPLETLTYFRTPTVASGNQVIIGLTNTHRALMTSGRVLQISGVNTAQTLTLDAEYLLYIKWNGASAVYELGTVSGHTRTGEIGVSIATGSINGSPYKIGSDFTPANFWDGWIGPVLTYNNDAGLTSQNKIDIWTAFGF
jgi:hypothetical protein